MEAKQLSCFLKHLTWEKYGDSRFKLIYFFPANIPLFSLKSINNDNNNSNNNSNKIKIKSVAYNSLGSTPVNWTNATDWKMVVRWDNVAPSIPLMSIFLFRPAIFKSNSYRIVLTRLGERRSRPNPFFKLWESDPRPLY